MAKRLRKFIWPAILAALCLAAYVRSALKPVVVETAEVTRGRIEEYVTEEAVTRLHTVRAVTALTSGIAARVELEEGDPVEAGQVVTTIEDTQIKSLLARSHAQVEEMKGYLEGVDAPLPEESEIAAAGKSVESAVASVEAAENNLEIARQDLIFAQKHFDRITRLRDEGSLTTESQDRAGRDYEVARKQVAAAEARLKIARLQQEVCKLQKNVLLESMDDTQHLKKVYGARIDQARAELENLSHEFSKTKVASPITGVVLEKYVDAEGFVRPGTQLLLVGDMTSIEIEADILSEEIGRISLGQKVVLVGKALGDQPPSATVQKIYPSGFTKVSTLGVRQQRVKVLIAFDNSRVQLGPGYDLDVKIITDARDASVLVPAGAVFATEDGMAVFKASGNRARFTPVTIGTRGEEFFEVVEGLEPGDRVVVRPPGDLESGDRIAAR